MRSLLCLMLVACGSPTPPSTSGVDPACLTKADAADGATDKLVHRCPNCGLAMDGKPEHSSTVDGYTLHSCSADCKGFLDADPAAVLERACSR